MAEADPRGDRIRNCRSRLRRRIASIDMLARAQEQHLALHGLIVDRCRLGRRIALRAGPRVEIVAGLEKDRRLARIARRHQADIEEGPDERESVEPEDRPRLGADGPADRAEIEIVAAHGAPPGRTSPISPTYASLMDRSVNLAERLNTIRVAVRLRWEQHGHQCVKSIRLTMVETVFVNHSER